MFGVAHASVLDIKEISQKPIIANRVLMIITPSLAAVCFYLE
jgi:hypothetical protein